MRFRSKAMQAIYNSRLEPEALRFAAVTLASYGNDDGTNIFPTARTVAHDLRCTERHVREMIHVLRDELQVLVRDGEWHGKHGPVPRYRIDIAALEKLPMTLSRFRESQSKKARKRLAKERDHQKDPHPLNSGSKVDPGSGVSSGSWVNSGAAVHPGSANRGAAAPEPLNRGSAFDHKNVPSTLTTKSGAFAPPASRSLKRRDPRSGATGCLNPSEHDIDSRRRRHVG